MSDLLPALHPSLSATPLQVADDLRVPAIEGVTDPVWCPLVETFAARSARATCSQQMLQKVWRCRAVEVRIQERRNAVHEFDPCKVNLL